MKNFRTLRDWLEALVILLAMLAVIAVPHPQDLRNGEGSVPHRLASAWVQR